MVATDIINAHLRYILAAGYSAETIKSRDQLLRRVDRDLPYGLDEAAPEELVAWLAQPGWSLKTRATYSEHLRSFYAWACDPEDRWLGTNPATALPRPRVPKGLPRPISREDLAQALRLLPDPWRLYAALAALAGLRCCELATVTREDITEAEVVVRGKGGRVRAIPTHPLIWAAVRDLPPGRIAWPVNGHPATASYISARGGLLLRSAGIPASLHQLRHRFGTDVNASGNTRVAQELLGHSSLATTAIYTLVTDAEKRRAVLSLNVASDWAAA